MIVSFFTPCLTPASTYIFRAAVEIWNVGLDVKQGCSIQHIHAFDDEHIVLARQQSHCG